MPNTTRFDIARLFQGILAQLRAEKEYFSRLTDHNAELGRLNESHLVRLLRSHLPPKIGIHSGFIVSGGTTPRQSPQCDIILYDALNNSPFYHDNVWAIYPIEMVYGVIEVKTHLTNTTLDDAFKKNVEIRSMAKNPDGESNKYYIIQNEPRPGRSVEYRGYSDGLPPRFFVFAYSGPKQEKTLSANFRKLTQKYDDAHIHGVCCLNDKDAYYVHHRALKPPSERPSEISSNGFANFLFNIPLSLSSMVPYHRNGLGFDRVDLRHYANSVT